MSSRVWKFIVISGYLPVTLILIRFGIRKQADWRESKLGEGPVRFFVNEAGQYPIGPKTSHIRIWAEEGQDRENFEFQSRLRQKISTWDELVKISLPEDRNDTWITYLSIAPEKLWFCYAESEEEVWVYSDGHLNRYQQQKNSGSMNWIDPAKPELVSQVPPAIIDYLAQHGEPLSRR